MSIQITESIFTHLVVKYLYATMEYMILIIPLSAHGIAPGLLIKIQSAESTYKVFYIGFLF